MDGQLLALREDRVVPVENGRPVNWFTVLDRLSAADGTSSLRFTGDAFPPTMSWR